MPNRILLADDSLTIQKVVQLTFSPLGAEVTVAGDGDQAIHILSQQIPDIVLADVVMPGKTGYEVCHYIKSTPALRHIPVLLLAGKFEPFDEAHAAQVGADGHIFKPFEGNVLVQTVSRLLAGPGAAVPARAPSSMTATPPLGETAAVRRISDAESFGAAAPFGEPDSFADPAPFGQPEPFGEPAPFAEPEPFGAPESFGAPEPFGAPEQTPRGVVANEFDDSPLGDDEPFGSDRAADRRAPFGSDAPLGDEAPFGGDSLAGAGVVSPIREAAPEPARAAGAVPAIQPSAGGDGLDIPDEVVDALVRRVTAKMTENVVRDIVWQVVPELAELLIKKKLDELQ